LFLIIDWRRKISRPLLILWQQFLFYFIQQHDFRVGDCLFYSINRAHFHGEQKFRNEMRTFFNDLRRWGVDLQRTIVSNDDGESQHMKN
jgi:hypothetical protein